MILDEFDQESCLGAAEEVSRRDRQDRKELRRFSLEEVDPDRDDARLELGRLGLVAESEIHDRPSDQDEEGTPTEEQELTRLA